MVIKYKVMRGKIGEADSDKDQYGFSKIYKNDISIKSRLDLNDLLKRMKDQKKNDKKANMLILSGALGLFLVVFLILSF